ncbi:hypothetical protein BH11ACT7_BH11ACT7_05520 [soil metagenome]
MAVVIDSPRVKDSEYEPAHDGDCDCDCDHDRA